MEGERERGREGEREREGGREGVIDAGTERLKKVKKIQGR
jgi:hypothetical protein